MPTNKMSASQLQKSNPNSSLAALPEQSCSHRKFAESHVVYRVKTDSLCDSFFSTPPINIFINQYVIFLCLKFGQSEEMAVFRPPGNLPQMLPTDLSTGFVDIWRHCR
jgi:hypothetical protein